MTVADEDLRDTRKSAMLDHLLNTDLFNDNLSGHSRVLYEEYVLNPRIDSDIISAWRKYLADNLPADVMTRAFDDPGILAGYIADNITIEKTGNYYGTPITPVGVDQLKVADE